MKTRSVGISGGTVFSNSGQMVLIAGPCVIESEKNVMLIAEKVIDSAEKAGIKAVFKASYDKANRSSVSSYRGPGIKKGLSILSKVRKSFSVPVLTDVHSPEEAKIAAAHVDILQIPAFLCRQTDLLVACAETGLPVNVKKGQFMAPEDMNNVIEKIRSCRNDKVLLTERGVSFGYHNLVFDPRSIAIMRSTGFPVIFDATHCVQQPGGLGKTTGGQRQFIDVLAKAAVSLCIAGVFVETHPDPRKALSDGPNSLSLKDLPGFVGEMSRFDRFVKSDI